VSATISSTFGRSLRAAGGHPASDAAAAAPAPATRNWRRVGTSRDSRTSSALSVSRCKGADRRRSRAPSHRVSRTSFGCRPLRQAPAGSGRERSTPSIRSGTRRPAIDSTVGATARVEANHQAGQVLELERLIAEAVLARDLLEDRVGPLSRAGSGWPGRQDRGHRSGRSGRRSPLATRRSSRPARRAPTRSPRSEPGTDPVRGETGAGLPPEAVPLLGRRVGKPRREDQELGFGVCVVVDRVEVLACHPHRGLRAGLEDVVADP
jgi:hypothetical protein